MALEKPDREILIRIDERLKIVEEKLDRFERDAQADRVRREQHQTEIELIKASASMAEAERMRIEKDLTEAKERFWERINNGEAEREKLRLDTEKQEMKIESLKGRWKVIGSVGGAVITALVIHGTLQLLNIL